MGIEVFQPAPLGASIFGDRYAAFDGETYGQGSLRVATHIAGAEAEELRDYWTQVFYEEIATNRFMPGGRIWYGAGKPKGQLLNCFVVPTDDSREGWAKTVHDVIIVSSLMGGVGINLSPVRGRGEVVKGTGGVATGAVSLGQMIDGVGDVIVGGGGRRMALMLCLNINHPDLEEFLNVKLNLDELNNANISLVIPTDMPTEYFQSLVRNDDVMPLVHDGEKKGEISARWVWNQLVENAWASGEPGVLNQYEANRMNNLHYMTDLVSTNPCGEIWLEPYGCCDLGALVLPRFVQNGEFQWGQFAETVEVGVRFLDNVLTVNHYPLPEIEENCKNVRRIGLGLMGLHTALMDMGIRYDSPEAIEFGDLLGDTMKRVAYSASVSLAVEKGPFPAFDPAFVDSGYAQTLPPLLRDSIVKYGIRNCALLTIAPTGTTSMVSGVSGALEPYPSIVYWRTYFKNTADGRRERQRELVVEEVYNRYPAEVLQGAADVPVRAHFEMQKVFQKHIDNAVSKTINLPNDYPKDELADLWLEYLPYMKGSTFYRWGSREFEPIVPVPRDEWERTIAVTNGSTNYHPSQTEIERADDMLALDCVGGVCEVPDRWQEKVAAAS